MASLDRSKKRIQLWKKAVFHFLICFVMGFFIGFAPTGNSSVSSFQPTAHDNQTIELAPEPLDKEPKQVGDLEKSSSSNRSLAETPVSTVQEVNLFNKRENVEENDLKPRRQVIVVTPTNDRDPLRGVLLRRLANTLKLVPPPLLWIVVESQLESSDVSYILRRTGVMYRHLVFKENFTDQGAETDYQRNLALNHIKHHRLSGIVHFAGLSNVYDLKFFNDIRAIEAMGTWALAKLSTRRKKVIIEGPVCQSSQVVGWHMKRETADRGIHISGFGFNSSILWDPERWGRLSSNVGTKQNSLKFVKQALRDEEAGINGLPLEDCSKVNLWQLHISTKTVPVNNVPDSTLGGRLRKQT